MEKFFRDLIHKTFDSIGLNIGDSPILKWLVVISGVLILLFGISFICRTIIIPTTKMLTKKTATKWDDILLNEKTLKKGCDLIASILIAAFIPFALDNDSLLYTIITRSCGVYITVVAIRFTCEIMNSLYRISNQAEKTKNHTMQGVFQMLKILSICVGCIIVIGIVMDKDPTTLLAGLGASAAILMLVFKDSIMGLVAGVQLSANDMLRPGDWIQLPKYGADGSVIEVTLTTVKVQNWDKTITTIPPYALVSDSFQNWRGMFDSGGRRIKRSIYIDMNSVAFCTPSQMEDFVSKGYIKEEQAKECAVNLTLFREWLEMWLRKHPSVNQKMMIMVRQLQPTAEGLPLELYFFYNGTQWVPYEHLQAEIIEQTLAVLPNFGLKVFQSPTGHDISNMSKIRN